jgi:glycosyltransferase involved in cell wall biosynthesis
MKKYKIGVGIPFYNDAEIISKTIASLISIDLTLSNKVDVEYFIWDDGSRVAESQVLISSVEAALALKSRIKVTRSEENLGYGNATREIKKYFSNVDLCILLDSELSMTKQDVQDMVDLYIEIMADPQYFSYVSHGITIKASRFRGREGLRDLTG